MRILLILAALALAAGCVTPDTTPTTPTNGTTNTTTDMAALPPPINDTKEVQGAADPGNIVTGAPCQTPNSQCFKYPFELNGSAHMAATLTWGQPASDFDLYVFQDGKDMNAGGASDVSTGPGTSEKIDIDLEAGSYELIVVAWAVAQDTYKVSATFGAPEG